MPISRRYRTIDGTCNNARKPRWGAAQQPFHRFLAPAYADGVDQVRRSVMADAPLSSARFVSLLVHGTRDEDAGVTHMLAQWGQFVDHDVTSTAQPRSINGSIPSCCDADDDDFQHPACLPIKVPTDDPWLAPLQIRCLEFLRSAPAMRPDCALSWREQTNQVTSYLDASTIYSSHPRTADTVRTFRDGRLHYGRGGGNHDGDVCHRHALSNQCIRSGDGRSGEQPGLLAMHHVWVGEHNRLAEQLAHMNGHWNDEKLFQEARRIVGAMVQHITYREFVPIVVGKEVSRLFDLELLSDGYYGAYDVKVNPTVANAFSAAAFRFGHSLIQGSYMRCAANHQFIFNNVSLHNENSNGDIGSAGSLDRMLRGLAAQRSQKRDEFITAELTNHLFQSGGFPFGLDLAAINIQRGRDHGIPSYTQWREPCGLSPIRDFHDLERVVGAESARRMEQGYRSIDDVDLFVAGLAERPVIGGLVGPTFACIIAQQFSNMRRGDRFWYENGPRDGWESVLTPGQLQSLRQVSLAQVMCRTMGGGTLQPHVFMPHETPGNERRACGVAELAPIDLTPWLERDPSFVQVEDRVHETMRESFHNKQESFELPAETSDRNRPHRRPIVATSVATPSSGPLPGSFIVELKPTSLTEPLRPNREPLRPLHHSTTTAQSQPARPAQTASSFSLSSSSPSSLRPSSFGTTFHSNRVPPSTTALPTSEHSDNESSNLIFHPVLTTPNTPSSSQSIVDKVDFLSNGESGIHVHTTDIDRPIDNKLDFDDKKRQTQIHRPNKRPIFHLDTILLRTLDGGPSTENAPTLRPEVSPENKPTEGRIDIAIDSDKKLTKTKRSVEELYSGTNNMNTTDTITKTIMRPSAKFGYVQKPRPPTQIIQYTQYRPNRPKPPNVVVLQGSSTQDLDLGPEPEDYPPPDGDRYGLYRPQYTSTTQRPNYQSNRYEEADQYAINYDVTVTTTEKYSIYKPVFNGQREPPPFFGPNNEPISERERPPQSYNVRPDRVNLGPPLPSKQPSHSSNPFSWDARQNQADIVAGKQLTDTVQERTDKLDFNADESPFSGGISVQNVRPGAIHVTHEDFQNDSVDDDDNHGHSSPMPTKVTVAEKPTVVNTTVRYPVLNTILTSLTRIFGVGITEYRQTMDGKQTNCTESNLSIESDETIAKQSKDLDFANITETVERQIDVETTDTDIDTDLDTDYTNSSIKQYDRDGYLRPELMQSAHRLTLVDQQRDTVTDAAASNDNEPVRPPPLHWHELQSRAKRPSEIISIVPFEVLTRPERPDNWVFVEPIPLSAALPTPPALASSANAVRETPRPLRQFAG